MKIIFNARDIIDAHSVSGMLNAHGIETYVGGYYLQGGIGEACGFDFANIQISDEDYEAARSIILEYEDAPDNNQETLLINIDGDCATT